METVIVLLISGAVLLLLETVLPGMIAGILGAICLIAGVMLGYADYGFSAGNWILAGTSAALLAGFAVWLKYFPGSRVARTFVSQKAIGDLGAERHDLLHKTGAAQSELRPSGAALIEGERVDVITEGEPIERGATIKVVAVEGLRVVVRRA